MSFITCQKCGRPLSEGAVARGDAVEHGGALTCSACCANATPAIAAVAQEPVNTGSLSSYDKTVWNCESCSIPVDALDLIEGRASKIGGRLVCSRCVNSDMDRPVGKAQESTVESKSLRKNGVSAARSLPLASQISVPRKQISNEASYTSKAIAESKKPILPIVLFAIILPMFAVSLYFAVMSQQKLNELRFENAAADKPEEPVDRSRPDPEPLVAADNSSLPEKPINNTEPEEIPIRPAPATTAPISEETIRQLADIEQELARPVNALLESDNLADVWEGLSQAGSQRLIACRPWVRRLLSDQDDNTRALSAHVCGLLEDEDALSQLDRMIDLDPSDQVRTQARKARSRLIGQASRELKDFSTDELETLLKDLQKELARRNRVND